VAEGAGVQDDIGAGGGCRGGLLRAINAGDDEHLAGGGGLRLTHGRETEGLRAASGDVTDAVAQLAHW
jgi:hypothetical protein